MTLNRGKDPWWLIAMAMVVVLGCWVGDAYLDRFMTRSASEQADPATERTIRAPDKLPGYVDRRHYLIYEAANTAEMVLIVLVVAASAISLRRRRG